MKAFARWLGRVIGSALTIVLVVLLLPHASRLLSSLLPDNGRGATISAVLSRKMAESARLETAVVDDEGILTSSVDALLIGQVQNVTIRYRYQASLGIDLTRVSLRQEGRTITLELPALEVLQDSLTPISVDRDDFWYPLSEKRRQTLLENERLSCREHYLSENAESAAAWAHTVEAMQNTVGQWLGSFANGYTIQFAAAEQTESEAP